MLTEVSLAARVADHLRAAGWDSNGVCVAVPHAKRSDGRDEAVRLARDHYAIGVIEVGDRGVRTILPFAYRDRKSEELRDSLSPEHQTHAAPGTNRGGQWTSFAQTAAAIAKIVSRHPDGCTIAEVVSELGHEGHHYASRNSATSAIGKAAKRGQIAGVRSGWRQRLYPVDTATGEEKAS